MRAAGFTMTQYEPSATSFFPKSARTLLLRRFLSVAFFATFFDTETKNGFFAPRILRTTKNRVVATPKAFFSPAPVGAEAHSALREFVFGRETRVFSFFFSCLVDMFLT